MFDESKSLGSLCAEVPARSCVACSTIANPPKAPSVPEILACPEMRTYQTYGLVERRRVTWCVSEKTSASKLQRIPRCLRQAHGALAAAMFPSPKPGKGDGLDLGHKNERTTAVNVVTSFYLCSKITDITVDEAKF